MADRTNSRQVLGCDVSKDSVTIFDSLSGRLQEVDNEPKALRRVLAELLPGPAADSLLVCEATGGYEARLLSAAWQAGLPAHRADPRKASNFARSLRSHGKTDSIDAQGLARYGLERADSLPLWQPPTPRQQALRDLVRLRAGLANTHADYARRLKAPGEGPHKRHIQATLEDLARRIQDLEAEIDSLIAQDNTLVERFEVVCAIPGCGRKTAIVLLALMPELGQLSRRQAAALAGYAPHPDDTGKHNGYRRVRGGRPQIKTALFMAALAASRYHPELSAHYQHLLAQGKKKLVALTAIARKLITIINAKIRDASYTREQLC